MIEDKDILTNDTAHFIITIFITLSGGLFAYWFYSMGVGDGRIDVASGEYVCHLMANHEWYCMKVK